jgi:hypothetical protein
MATEEKAPRTRWWNTTLGGMLGSIGVVAVLGLAVFGWNQLSEAREHDRRVDENYCTLSGVDRLDRAPESGELCADVLYGD